MQINLIPSQSQQYYQQKHLGTSQLGQECHSFMRLPMPGQSFLLFCKYCDNTGRARQTLNTWKNILRKHCFQSNVFQLRVHYIEVNFHWIFSPWCYSEGSEEKKKRMPDRWLSVNESSITSTMYVRTYIVVTASTTTTTTTTGQKDQARNEESFDVSLSGHTSFSFSFSSSEFPQIQNYIRNVTD